MHKSRNMFFNKLENYRNRICIIDPVVGKLSYDDVIENIRNIQAALEGKKKLIFLEADSTVSTITAYLSALRAGHAVHLLDPCRKQDNKELIKIYKPDILFKAGGQKNNFIELKHDNSKIADNLLLLLATSGSTGSKKLVKISYHNLQTNTDSINKYLANTPEDRAITSLKLHYSYGMSVLNTILDIGGSIVLSNKESFDLSFWENLNHYNVTCFSGVPHHFKTFDHLGLKWENFNSLRYVTQAGGKLSADIIKKQATQCVKTGKQFFVMYGQTEASPRMSYLPPEDVLEYAQCIGIAVPGGRFRLIDDKDRTIDKDNVPGELIYEGDNVMSGYALSADDLSFMEDLKELKTGDLAHRNEKGYYTIVGRKSRFIKPFGIRVNLDDVENFLQNSNPETYVVGNDEKMLIVYTKSSKKSPDIAVLCRKYNLPKSLFVIKAITEVPLLPNGKIDYKKLEESLIDQRSAITRTLYYTKRFIVELFCEFFAILFTASGRWHSVLDLYKVCFPGKKISGNLSFHSLGGDSLKYIEVSLGLEKLINTVPENWHKMSINELEHIRNAANI